MENEMSNHTPGPWTVDTSGNVPGWHEDGRECLSIVSYFPTIAVVNNNKEEFNGRANALLIAAAPDLLEACRGLLDAIHDSMTHESQNHHREQIDAARAAVEKAEGETK